MVAWLYRRANGIFFSPMYCLSPALPVDSICSCKNSTRAFLADNSSCNSASCLRTEDNSFPLDEVGLELILEPGALDIGVWDQLRTSSRNSFVWPSRCWLSFIMRMWMRKPFSLSLLSSCSSVFTCHKIALTGFCSDKNVKLQTILINETFCFIKVQEHVHQPRCSEVYLSFQYFSLMICFFLQRFIWLYQLEFAFHMLSIQLHNSHF